MWSWMEEGGDEGGEGRVKGEEGWNGGEGGVEGGWSGRRGSKRKREGWRVEWREGCMQKEGGGEGEALQIKMTSHLPSSGKDEI